MAEAYTLTLTLTAAVPNLKDASRAELDSNCYTCCFGKGVYVTEDTLRTISA